MAVGILKLTTANRQLITTPLGILNIEVINNEGGVIMDKKIIEKIIEREEPPELITEYEHLFRTLFENSDEAIVVMDPDAEGSVLEVNQTAVQMHGYTIEEMRKLKASDIHPADVQEHAEEAIKRVIEGETIEAEHDHLRKDGSRFPVRFRLFATYYLGRRVVVSFVRDITHERAAKDALLRCEDELAAI